MLLSNDEKHWFLATCSLNIISVTNNCTSQEKRFFLGTVSKIMKAKLKQIPLMLQMGASKGISYL